MANNTISVEFDEKKIDAIFAELNQCHLPGAAVGISIGGRPVYRKGFGLANMELPLVLSSTTRMRIGSTTKHFAAFAYMLLCEDGKAGIDDPVGKYLPELHPITHNVTMRQLMGNIGGLRDSLDICLTFSGYGRRVSTDEIVSLYRNIDDVNAAPGSAWIYNNGGWQMLTIVIERITGQSLEDVLSERVFEPIGMYQSMLRRDDYEFVPNSASRHMTNPAGRYEKKEESNLFATSMAAEGGMVSTVDDMLLWLANMDKHLVGSAATWKVMKAPQRLANGTSTGYGLGLATVRYRGIETLFHPGGGTGTNTQMLKVPATGLDVVCIVNRHDVSSYVLAHRILDACLPGLDPIEKASGGPLPPGIFRSPTTGRVIQFRTSTNAYWLKEEQQIEGRVIISIDGTDGQFVPDDDGVLRAVGYVGVGAQEIMLVGDRAKTKSIRFSDYGNLDELVAVQPGKSTDIALIAGRYHSASTGVDATISDSDEGPRLHTVGPFGPMVYLLEYLADGVWRAVSQIVAHRVGILSFDGDGAGFRYSSWNTRSLPFRRVG